ncbi:hypothetical protein SAMN04490202_3352 [Pseudomonas reinekei]|uniref:TerB family tellurite resistance protein n=1 Tax=Pseudomonas reinekei TaxID=395598 RepID=A0A1H0QYJ7_PSERE|nr:hypothetical protein [Pseudomonas reinekei]KAB0481173.1 hypothetical protein F7R15_25915 [Pseudomonas reinekei]OLT99464.1 hypothetical protein BVK86_25600 [Pseudomonas reinekei]SDP22324.1 hypothetical protein SAMN04490202_3352 [Pseudomonas reinekei]
MLIKLLSDSDKKHLLELSKLLALADKPLLWDGKTSDEFTSSTDLSALSIQEGAQERELIAELEKSISPPSSTVSLPRMMRPVDVGTRLIEALKKYPIPKAEKPETRVQAATTVLKEILKGKKFELPTAPKVILFELLLVALRDGTITSVEWALLKEFQLHHQLEDFIFDDLLERAETLNQEVSKTISIILE